MMFKRALSSWCFASFVVLLFTMNNITNAEYLKDTNIFIILALVIASFLIFTLLNLIWKRVGITYDFDTISLFVSVFLYATTLSFNASDTLFYVALSLILLVSIIVLYNSSKIDFSKITFQGKKYDIAIIAIGVFIFAYISFITCCRYIYYCSPNFDFGIWVNMFYNMKKNFSAITTCERDMVLSHFSVHFSPIWYVLLPVYYVFPSPLTLQICQAAIVSSAIVPLYFICKKYSMSKAFRFVVCGSFGVYAAIYCGCNYDIHENCFLLPLILWMFYFFEKDKKIPLYLFAILILLVKEDAFIYVVFAGIYFIISRKKYITGIIFILLGSTYFIGVSLYMTSFGNGIMSSRYENFLHDDQSLYGMLLNIIKNPASVFYQAFNEDYPKKLLFLLQIFVPLGFIPFISKDFSRLTLLLPMLLINLMTNYQYQYDIGFQYVFGSVAFVFYAFVINLNDLQGNIKRVLSIYVLCSGLLLFHSEVINVGYYFRTYHNNNKRNETFDEALALIPENVSVKASSFLLPHLAQRDEIYTMYADYDCEYVVIDLRRQNKAEEYYDLFIEDGYEVFYTDDYYIAILHKNLG